MQKIFKGLILIVMVLGTLISCETSLDDEDGGCGERPIGSGVTWIRIIQVLPNPEGPYDDGENFVLKNFGTKKISMAGWRILNRYNVEWKMDPVGYLGQCEQKTLITRNDNSLDNDLDTIRLYDSKDSLIQMVAWMHATEGEIIYPK